MTVATTINRLSFNGDDTTILFTYTFKVFEESDIKVIVRSALGVETTLTLDTDYTVTVSETAGGTVTLIGTYAATPPATGETIIVYREIPYTQEIDPVENDPQRADVAEEGLDRAVILIQQLKDAISRSIQLPISTTYSGLALPEPEAAKYLGWNDAGTELENRDLISSVGVSPFMTTVLDDTTAAAARTTLGAMANPMSAPGDIIYGGASGAPTKLIKGTASQVLTMNSGATAPKWGNALCAGAYELTDDATIAIDWDNGASQYVTIAATGRTVTFANPISGQVYRLIIIQDGDGARTITTWPTIKWAGGAAPTLSTAANSTDIVTLLYVGTTYYGDCSHAFAVPA